MEFDVKYVNIQACSELVLDNDQLDIRNPEKQGRYPERSPEVTEMIFLRFATFAKYKVVLCDGIWTQLFCQKISYIWAGSGRGDFRI